MVLFTNNLPIGIIVVLVLAAIAVLHLRPRQRVQLTDTTHVRPHMARSAPAEGTAAPQAQQTLFGGPAPRSAGETSMLNRAGAADPGIRSSVNSPTTFTVDKGTTTQAILAAPPGDGQAASVAIPANG